MRALALGLLAGSMILPLDYQAMNEALAIAHSSLDATHRRFHADYHFHVGRAPVDFASVVSPFRRVVLSAETAARMGRRMFGQREAIAALKPDPERFEVYVELTFHPHNTFVGVPDYAIELEPVPPRGRPIVPAAIDRLPRFGPRLEDGWYPLPYPYNVAPRTPAGSQPLQGGTLIGRFAGHQLDAKAAYDMVVRDGRKELARTRVDLARLR